MTTSGIRVAVIGTGYFSQFHYRAWVRMPEVVLSGLHAEDRSAGLRIARSIGEVSVFDTVAELLDGCTPDIVDIVTPPASHDAIIRTCLGRVPVIICQKPFCEDLQEATRLVHDIASSSSCVVVHENFRFQPWYRKLRELLDAGLIGNAYEIRFNLRPGDGQGPSAYLERQPYFQQQKRFLIRETGIHLIDVFRYLMGDVKGLFARLARLNPVIAGEDSGIVLLEFTSGARGIFNGNRLVDHASGNSRLTMGEMTLEGSLGTLTLDGWGAIRIRRHGEAHASLIDFSWHDIDFGGDCVYLTCRHVVEHLLRGSTLENGAADYLVNRQIETAIYTSHEQGGWVAMATEVT